MPEFDDPTAAVLFEEQKTVSGQRIAIATLNAQRSLNALTLGMVRALQCKLEQWSKDERIACVVLRGAGERAFCAGGDVRSLRESVLSNRGTVMPNPYAQAFFSEEYRLDFSIHTYRKPIVIWGTGIVMGGGLGLLAGASHRIVTGTSRIAMPEISIGLFPDVGGSWFLSRMPHRAGLFLALTGASINGADACYLGLGDYFLRASDYDALLLRLISADWSIDIDVNHAIVSRLLRALAHDAASMRPASKVRVHADDIERLTDAATLSEIAALIAGYAGDDAWMMSAASTLASGSPTAAALIWVLRQRSKHLSLADVFRLELIVALQCCEHPDFAEGTRAVLIDRDNAPQWTPACLRDVTPDWIEAHFVAPWSAWAGEGNPLDDLPSRAAARSRSPLQ
jgi:enoyl-CoA hydratase/carnithine racemase